MGRRVCVDQIGYRSAGCRSEQSDARRERGLNIIFIGDQFYDRI